MANRTTAPAPEEAPVSETTPAPEVPESSNPPVEGEKSETTEAAKPAKVEPDMSGFEAAAQAVIDAGDEQPDYSALLEAYKALDRKGRGLATKYVNNQVIKAIKEDKDKLTALAWVNLGDAVTSKAIADKGGEPRKPVNPTESYVERTVALFLAYEVASSEDNRPEGLDEDWLDKFNKACESARTEIATLVTWRKDESDDKGEAPEVSDIASRAVRLAFQGTGRKSGAGTGTGHTYEGPRRSVSAHIESAFADVASGTFLSVADIRNHKSDEYGDDHPSAGAVSAALKGKSVPEGITPTTGGEKGTFGAKKA